MPAVLDKIADLIQSEGVAALAAGAPVVTLEGVMPIEFVEPGDRIVTRSGVRTLTDVRRITYSGEALVVLGGSLGHCLPGENTILTPETRIVLRDWRARALFGMDQALVVIDALEDGEFVRRIHVEELPMFTLVFDDDEVIYAGGMEVAATDRTYAQA